MISQPKLVFDLHRSRKVYVFFEKIIKSPIALCAAVSILLNMIIEAAGRHSLPHMLEFAFGRPAVFFLNALIIFASLSTALLFRRRILAYTVWSLAWLTLGITNGVILSYRMTPFTMTDLSLLESGLSVIPSYLSKLQIGLVIAAMTLAALLFVLLFLFAPRKRGAISRGKNAVVIVLIFAALAAATVLGTRTHVIGAVFGNLAYAYRDYGVPYCFLNTWLNTGIKRPFGYSERGIRAVFSAEETEAMYSYKLYSDAGATSFPEKLPSIIFLQLESFIDPVEIEGLAYSEEPAPWFHSLRAEFSSGYLTVPSIGAGTANTEFEVLSGMSTKFFGPGEYPYKSILRELPCESLAYNLRSLGYTAHAIHNHRGAFYNRNRVFANLGFDTFTSLEYMNGVTLTPRNWARDDVLLRQITGAMDATAGRDFIFAISVQGHGSYPEKAILPVPAVRVSGLEDEARTNAFEYYLQQIREMDDFLRRLTANLENRREDILLVLYGDHLPALDLGDGDMAHGSSFETEYVIWDNFGLEKQDKDLYAYQLAAETEARLGLTQGTLPTYHQYHAQDRRYLENLRSLQYDMLYGSGYIYGGRTPFRPTALQMGFSPIETDEITEIGGAYYIRGRGFTSYSKASVGDKIFETEFLSPQLLRLSEELTPEEAAALQISQVEKNNEILSTAE
ncbi:MAG: LTA synthase family protein [Clostridiales Family XIII bacterium]|jgi:phosphoglycerol transferase MdoB-like AlkP superfamily enzyme|nr:LTA synthase family protein [Clostridiales Family XIII bacterium]